MQKLPNIYYEVSTTNKQLIVEEILIKKGYTVWRGRNGNNNKYPPENGWKYIMCDGGRAYYRTDLKDIQIENCKLCYISTNKHNTKRNCITQI